jgi:hypothetical protein
MSHDVVMTTSEGKQIAFSSAMGENTSVFVMTEYYANICNITIGCASESIAIAGWFKLHNWMKRL